MIVLTRCVAAAYAERETMGPGVPIHWDEPATAAHHQQRSAGVWISANGYVAKLTSLGVLPAIAGKVVATGNAAITFRVADVLHRTPSKKPNLLASFITPYANKHIEPNTMTKMNRSSSHDNGLNSSTE